MPPADYGIWTRHAFQLHWDSLKGILPTKEASEAVPRCYTGRRNYMIDFNSPEAAKAAYEMINDRTDSPVMQFHLGDETFNLTVKRDTPSWINLLRRHFARVYKELTTVLKESNNLRGGISVHGTKVVLNWDTHTVRTLFFMSVDEQGLPKLSPNSEMLESVAISAELAGKWKAWFLKV